jgi:hypothetical protein
MEDKVALTNKVALTVSGVQLAVPAGTTVAVAMMLAGQPCRISVHGERRGPLCGMGICFECRAVINGRRHSRSCQILCETGMEVKIDDQRE